MHVGAMSGGSVRSQADKMDKLGALKLTPFYSALGLYRKTDTADRESSVKEEG